MDLNAKVIQVSTARGRFWLRIFGFGISGKDTRSHHVFFSERMGIIKHYYIGPWSFTFLRPNNP